LQSLRSCGALKLCLRRRPHPPLCLLAPAAGGVPSQHASDTTYHPYAREVPSQHASNAAYHPYGCIVPAQHASNSAYHPYACSALLTCLQRSVPSLPLWMLAQHASDAPYHLYACGVSSRHAFDAVYHPYACIVPTQHASNTAYHRYACSALPTCLQRWLPSLCSQFPPDMPLTPPSHWPNPQGCLGSLCSCSPLKIRLQHLPPSLPYFLCHFPSLHSRGAIKICLRCHSQPPLRLILSPPLTILTLRY
ncbi:hypothetical protein O181_132212, partial [Austropuccinia psidii MF-1]|nr:hypothetical protein [Austropuccinia psidii MF-1]